MSAQSRAAWGKSWRASSSVTRGAPADEVEEEGAADGVEEEGAADGEEEGAGGVEEGAAAAVTAAAAAATTATRRARIRLMISDGSARARGLRGAPPARRI